MGCSSSIQQKELNEFPSPHGLARTQRRLAARALPQLNAYDKSGHPVICPPQNTKAEIFSHDYHKASDIRAMKAGTADKWQSYADLVNHLKEGIDEDISRVRALYMWLVSQNPENLQLTEIPSDDSPAADILKAKLGITDFASILKTMCRCTEIPCEVIQGKIKVSPTGCQTDGSWCSVFVSKSWRLLDPVMGRIVPRPHMVTGRETRQSNKRPVSGDVDHSGYDEITTGNYEKCFLTDPEVFIVDHFPNDPQWQLLHRTVEVSQFDGMLFYDKQYFDLEITDISHVQKIIECHDGRLDLTWSFKQGKDVIFKHKLVELSKRKDRLVVYSSSQYSALVAVDRASVKLGVEFPYRGVYRLCLYGKESDKGEFSRLCTYVIKCSHPAENFIPIPENNHRQFGKPVNIREDFGVLNIEPSSGIITTDNGEVSFTLTFDPDIFTDVFASLANETVDAEDLRKCIVYWIDENKIRIKVCTPHVGAYVLRINAKGYLNQAKFHPLCAYLIKCTCPYAHASGFALEPFMKLGLKTIPTKCLQLKKFTHPNPMIQHVDAADLTLSIETRRQVTATTHLKTQRGVTVSAEDLDKYVFIENKDGKHTTFHVRFPRSGIYYLTCVFKESETRKIVPAFVSFTYLIDVKTPSSQPGPFPTTLSDWSDQFRLLKPKSYFIQPKTTTDVSVSVLGASEVGIMWESKGGYSMLKQEPDESWTGVVEGKKSDKGKLLCWIGKKAKNLLEFKILSEAEAAEHAKEQNVAQEAIEIAQREYEERRAFTPYRKHSLVNSAYDIDEWRDEAEEAVTRRLRKRLNEANDVRNMSPEDQQELMRKEIESQLINSEMETTEFQRWKNLVDTLKIQMFQTNLSDAMRRGDRRQLATAIEECKEMRFPELADDIAIAEKKLKILEARYELLQAVNSGKAESVVKCMTKIKDAGYTKDLTNDMRTAMKFVDALKSQARITNLQQTALKMDQKLMTEIIRYAAPPVAVHKVMVAALLLTGEDEESTQDWRTCQRLCSLTGGLSLHRRIQTLSADDLHPEIVARAKEILSDLDYQTVKNNSAGACTFYIWSMTMIDSAEQRFRLERPSVSPPPPAALDRQREIFQEFGRPAYKHKSVDPDDDVNANAGDTTQSKTGDEAFHYVTG